MIASVRIAEPRLIVYWFRKGFAKSTQKERN